jgi:hypothetical protein
VAQLQELNARQSVVASLNLQAQFEAVNRTAMHLLESRSRMRYFERSMEILVKESGTATIEKNLTEFSMYALLDNYHFWHRERIYAQTIERNELSSWIDNTSKFEKKGPGKSVVEEDIEEAVSKMPEINLDFKETKVAGEEQELPENGETKPSPPELGKEGLLQLDQLREQNREQFRYQSLVLNTRIPKKSSLLVSTIKMLQNTIRLLWGLSSQRQGEHLKSYDKC